MQRSRRTVWNGLRLRCPRCGRDPLFRGLFRMNGDCSSCGLHYEREAGYFIGAIYLNYAATTLIAIGGFFLVDHFVAMTMYEEIAVWAVFATAFPLLFFRYSRSLWLALDHVFSPEPRTLRAVRPPRRSVP